jgi:hypothetical protein
MTIGQSTAHVNRETGAPKDRRRQGEATEVPDFRNGATESTERTEKQHLLSVPFVFFVPPFLKSGISVTSGPPLISR